MQDNLSDLLQTVRVDDTCCIKAELTAPWGCRHDQLPGAMFYICMNGSAYLANRRLQSRSRCCRPVIARSFRMVALTR